MSILDPIKNLFSSVKEGSEAKSGRDRRGAMPSDVFGKRSIFGYPDAEKYGASDPTTGYFNDSTERMMGNWEFSTQTPDFYLYSDLEKLRARSRALIRKSAHGKKFLNLMVKGLIGNKGVIANARVTKGISGDTVMDDRANEAIEAQWKDWCVDPSNCDHREMMSFVDLQESMIKSWVTDGEFIVRVHEGNQAGPHGIRLELIDPEYLDIYKSTNTAGGGEIRLGVEYDSEGRRLRYHFRKNTRSMGYGGQYIYNGGQTYTVEASHIIHGYRPDQIDQSRGVPLVHASLIDLRQTDNLVESLLYRSRIAANASIGVTSDKDAPYEGNAEGPDGLTQQLSEPGEIIDFGDREAKMLEVGFPTEAVGEMMKSFQRKYSAGMDVSYAALTGDLADVNFSSIRAGLLEDRENYMALQDWFIRTMVRPVYFRWLTMALLKERVVIGGRPLQRPIAHYKKVEFMGRRWPWVNPQQDANAKSIMLEKGMTSLTEICNEFGSDFEKVVQDRAREQRIMEAAGVKLTPGDVGNKLIEEDDDQPPPKK